MSSPTTQSAGTPAILARLAALTPEETDSRAASSVSQCVDSLTSRVEMRGGVELSNGSRTPATYQVEPVVYASSLDQIEAARARVAHCMAVPDQRMMFGWMAELSIITARRTDDDATEELRAHAYARRLGEYPADIVRHVLLIERWKFFPTCAELLEKCDALVSKRKALASALDRAERSLLNPVPTPPETPAGITEEERARRAALVQEIWTGPKSMKEA